MFQLLGGASHEDVVADFAETLRNAPVPASDEELWTVFLKTAAPDARAHADEFGVEGVRNILGAWPEMMEATLLKFRRTWTGGIGAYLTGPVGLSLAQVRELERILCTDGGGEVTSSKL